MSDMNPIKYSDLISPDDSINTLITQLEKLLEVYNGVAGAVKKNADDMLASLRAVSGATDEGRASIQGLNQETANLGRAYRIVNNATTETAKRIAELKEQARQEDAQDKRITKLKVERNRAMAGSYNALSAQYRLNKEVLNNLSAEMRRTNPEAKKLEEETRKIYEEMKRLQEATGKFQLNVGNYEGAINNAIGAQSKWFKSLQMLGGLFEGGFTNGVKAATSAVGGFGKQLLALMMNPIVAAIAAIAAAFMGLAEGIRSSEENTMALQRILAPFHRTMTGLLNVLQETAGWILKIVEENAELAMYLSRLMENIPKIGMAIKAVNTILDANNAKVRESIELEKEKQALTLKNREMTITEAKVQRNIAKWRRDAEMTNDPAKRVQLLKMANAAEHGLMLDKIAIQKRVVATLEKEAAMAHNDAEANDRLAQAKADLYRLEGEYYQRTTRLQSKIRNNENKLNGGTGIGSKAGTNDAEREAREQERLQKEKSKRELDAIRAAEDAKADLIENEYDKQRAKTILQYDRQVEDLKAQMATMGDDEVRAKEAINERIIALEQQKWNKLADITQKEMDDAYNAEMADYNKRMKAADALVKRQEQQAAEQLRKEKEIAAERKRAVQEAVDYAVGYLQDYLDAWMEVADQQRQKADEQVERARNVVEAEIEARNNGYAANVALAQKELDQAKKNQEKAIKEQQRAQKASEAVQTMQQVSSLVTATANIWAAFTEAGPWGIAAAIAATAVMFGAFAASKIQAAKAARGSTEEYGEGTVELLQGGSHQSGNDIDLGRKKDGTRRRAEGGEYFAVINRRNSRKYHNLIPQVINALNDGTFAEKYMGAYGGQGVNVNVGQSPDISSLANDVHIIRKQGEESRYVDGKGNTVAQYKNLRRIIKK